MIVIGKPIVIVLTIDNQNVFFVFYQFQLNKFKSTDKNWLANKNSIAFHWIYLFNFSH